MNNMFWIVFISTSLLFQIELVISQKHLSLVDNDEFITLEGAKNLCKSKNLIIASIGNEQENNVSIELCANSANHRCWVGGKRQWKWIGDTPFYEWKWIDGTPIYNGVMESNAYGFKTVGSNSPPWKQGFPALNTTVGIYIDGKGEWVDTDYDIGMKAGVICEEFKPFRMFGSGWNNWPNAQQQCHDNGLVLASIKNEEENKIAMQLCANIGCWTGGYREGVQVGHGTWSWSDGTPITNKSYGFNPVYSTPPWSPSAPIWNQMDYVALVVNSNNTQTWIDCLAIVGEPVQVSAPPNSGLCFSQQLRYGFNALCEG